MRASASALRASSASENGRTVAADDLPGFVALAGDQQRVALLQHRRRRRGSPRARSPISSAPGRGGENRGADRGRVLRARIVVGDDDDVGRAGRDLAHDRPLARVAVAAAAEDDDRAGRARRGAARPAPSPARRACGRSRRTRRRRGSRRPARADPARLRAPASAAKTASASEPVAMHSPAATSALETWKSPGSGRRTRRLRPPNSRSSVDGEAVARRRSRAGSPRPCAPTVKTVRPRASRGRDHPRRDLAVGVDHRRRAVRQQVAEQPQLGGEIVLDRRVVIHVVARQVGEGGGGEPARRRAASGRARARRPPSRDA